MNHHATNIHLRRWRPSRHPVGRRMKMWNHNQRPIKRSESIGLLQKILTVLITVGLYLSLGLLAQLAGAQQSITVYTVSSLAVPIPKAQQSITRVIELDRILQIEKALETDLEDANPEAADQTARSRLTDQHQRELTLAWRGLARVQSGEITRLPAIVFDDQAVWYGRQFQRAFRAWHNWQNNGGRT